MGIFATPFAFFLLLILPVLVFFVLKFSRAGGLKYSSLTLIRGGSSWRTAGRYLLIVLRLLCLACLVFAIARPRKGISLTNISTKGVAIEMVVDRSSSMNEKMNFDGKPLSRYEVVKKVASEFILGNDDDLQGRTGDMIGLINFARYPDTVCPLVLSHNLLVDFLDQSKTVTLRSEDGTAIGEALALAVARLKTAEKQIVSTNKSRFDGPADINEPDFEIKSKVVVLLTDGSNNTGEITPDQAAEMAKDCGVKIYVIAINSPNQRYSIGGFGIPMSDGIDDNLMNRIAETTGGFYAKADDAQALRDIYSKINELEETEVENVQYYEYAELFMPFAITSILLILLELFAGTTIFRKIP